jgi:hypothetical protein
MNRALLVVVLTLFLFCRSKGGPDELIVALFDGMDQAKSAFPRLVRDSKDTDPSKGAIAVHIVNAFLFGGPVPILGFLNTAEIVKNSSLTVINLHRSITVQFEALMEQERLRIEELKKNNPAATEEECRVKLTTWPRRLHLCFDNAGGENMNSNVFLYLSVLVHMGVFEYITVSTLFVGHTHNINDQVFSVWSRWMDANDCVTLEMIMEGFSNNYHAFVKKDAEEADAIVNAETPKPAATSTATSEMPEEKKESEDFETGKGLEKLFTGMKKSTLERKKRRQDLLHVIRKCGEKAQPKVERVLFNAHIGGWLPTPMKDRIEKEKVFTKINDYHVFAFGKEDGNTYLFRKFTVAAEMMYQEFRHEHLFQGVKYRKKNLVFMEADKIDTDPMRMPFNFVDTTKATECMNTLARAHVFDKYPGARVQLQATINQLASQSEAQRESCATCQGFVDNFARIGVIKRPVPCGIADVDAQKKSEYNALITARRNMQTELNAHLSDPSAAHENQICRGWWTDWIKDRIPLIDAHYRSRNIFLNGKGISAAVGLPGIAAHPHDFTAEEAFAINRTVSLCNDLYGPPRAGDIVILRAEREKQKPPFWVASVRAYRNRTIADADLQEEVKKVAQDRRNAKGRLPPWPENYPGLDLPEVIARVDGASAASKGGGRRKGKDRLQEVKYTFEFQNVLVDWFVHFESAPKRKSQGDGRKGKKAKRNSSSHQSGSEDDEEEKEVAMDNEDDVPLSQLVEGAGADEEMAESDDSHSQDLVAPLREEDINPFRNCKYRKCSDQENLEPNRWMNVSEIICWGPPDAVFGKSKAIKEGPWKWIIQDLTQAAQPEE